MFEIRIIKAICIYFIILRVSGNSKTISNRNYSLAKEDYQPRLWWITNAMKCCCHSEEEQNDKNNVWLTSRNIN